MLSDFSIFFPQILEIVAGKWTEGQLLSTSLLSHTFYTLSAVAQILNCPQNILLKLPVWWRFLVFLGRFNCD